MYGGRVVERGAASDVFRTAAHPYTQALLATVESGEISAKAPFLAIPGNPPVGSVPSGCPFHPRCGSVLAVCPGEMPATTTVGPRHTAACHLLQQVA
jgi:oligopeptide/dipeptide ABC transporter ATP-binding protein